MTDRRRQGLRRKNHPNAGQGTRWCGDDRCYMDFPHGMDKIHLDALDGISEIYARVHRENRNRWIKAFTLLPLAGGAAGFILFYLVALIMTAGGK